MTTMVRNENMNTNLEKAYKFFNEVERWKINTKKRIAKYQATVIGMGILIVGLITYIITNL